MKGSDSRREKPIASDAMRLLARRPLSEAELRRGLEARGHGAEAIDAVCARLREAGYVDDHRLALDFIVARAERLAHGPVKLVAELRRRGIEREVAEGALDLAVRQGDLAPRKVLRRRLRRHLAGAPLPLSPRDYARVYNALRRAGFDEDAIRQELDGCRKSAPHDDPIAEEATDDFA